MHYTGVPLQAHVSAAKAAIDSLSASCAIELGPKGITSNVISPGAIRGTEGVERLTKKEDLVEQAKGNPMGRIGSVKDVADATIWLCGPSAGFINGVVLVGMWYFHLFALKRCSESALADWVLYM